MLSLKRLFILFVIAINYQIALGQVIRGIIYDSVTKMPVSYTGIGVLRKDIGTVSEMNGKFNLDISKASNNDTLRISNIGYKNIDIPIKAINTVKDSNIVFSLIPLIKDIKEIIIRGGKLKSKVVGNTVNGGMFMTGFPLNTLGTEIATVLKYNEENPGKLNNINFNIANNTFDSVLFKVIIYNFSNGRFGEPIVSKPIILKFSKRRGTLTSDLQDSSIYINNDVVLCLELVKIYYNQKTTQTHKPQLNFWEGLFNSPTYYRPSIEAEWIKIPGVGFWADVSYIK